mgnify:FL=1
MVAFTRLVVGVREGHKVEDRQQLDLQYGVGTKDNNVAP